MVELENDSHDPVDPKPDDSGRHSSVVKARGSTNEDKLESVPELRRSVRGLTTRRHFPIEEESLICSPIEDDDDEPRSYREAVSCRRTMDRCYGR